METVPSIHCFYHAENGNLLRGLTAIFGRCGFEEHSCSFTNVDAVTEDRLIEIVAQRQAFNHNIGILITRNLQHRMERLTLFADSCDAVKGRIIPIIVGDAMAVYQQSIIGCKFALRTFIELNEWNEWQPELLDGSVYKYPMKMLKNIRDSQLRTTFLASGSFSSSPEQALLYSTLCCRTDGEIPVVFKYNIGICS